MILCCGEALIDMIPEPTCTGNTGFVPRPGGSVFNTALALGRLGIPAGMLTGLSRDMFGLQLRDALTAANVDISHIITSARPTTLAFVRLANGQAHYSFLDENSAGRMLEPADMPPLAPHVRALYFGGISLACEPAAHAYAALLEENRHGRAVMLDPNIRPGFIAGSDGFRTRLERMTAQADIVKVSDEDLDWIDPGPLPEAGKARRLLDRGPSLVIVTRGADGASGYLSGGGIVTVPAPAVTIVDTVGAGDTFNAGFLAELHRSGYLARERLAALDNATLRRALAFGAGVAAVTVTRPGADPPFPADLPQSETG